MHSTPISLLQRLSEEPQSLDWQRFVNLYTPLIFYWARRSGLQPDDAEDLVQDVFTSLLKGLGGFKYDRNKSFRAWLRTVTLNKWRDRSRRAQRRLITVPLGDGDTQAPEPIDHSEQEYYSSLIKRALELIEPEFQKATWQAFRATALDGETIRNAASQLGMTENAVYIARCRVLKRLSREVEGMWD